MTGVDHATATELRITHPTSPNGKVHSPISPKKMPQHHFTVVGKGAMFGPYSTP